jgi:hypothetical protein
MFKAKSMFLLLFFTIFLLLCIVMVNTGCNLFISLVEPNNPPVAIVCTDIESYIYEEVILNGNNSYDPDMDPLTYEWSISSVPENVIIENRAIKNRTSPTASIVLTIVGTYVFSLEVSDGNSKSSDELTVFVDKLDPNPDPTSPPQATRPPDTNSTHPPETN